MLRKIPGIGDYTAGAIASIAFKEVGCLRDFGSWKVAIGYYSCIKLSGGPCCWWKCGKGDR